MSVDRSSWPVFVRVGLWGLPNKASAWAFFWLSVAIAVASVAYGFRVPVFLLGGGMVIAAAWYYAAIRWVDLNGRWS